MMVTGGVVPVAVAGVVSMIMTDMFMSVRVSPNLRFRRGHIAERRGMPRRPERQREHK